MAWFQHEYHYTLYFGSDDAIIDEVAPNADGGSFEVGRPPALDAVLFGKLWAQRISRAEIDSHSTPITPSLPRLP